MPADEMVGAEMTEYTPDSIREVAEILAPQAGNYTNAITSQIGQAQQSMGPLAAATMGQSQTAGLGNYTYNRLVRPQVDAMRDEILVQGYTNALNKMLSDRLRAARANYSKSSGGGSSDKNNNNNSGTGVTTINGSEDEEKKTPSSENGEATHTGSEMPLTGSEAYAQTVNHYNHILTKDELQKIFNRPMSDEAYKVYRDNYYTKIYKTNPNRSYAGGEIF